MDDLILLLELIGTIAFAVSGAMVGLRKQMDLFGVCILGLTTAVGGGILRDLVLGNTPPNTFQSPVYGVTALGASLLFFLPAVRRVFLRVPSAYDRVMLWMDSLGLAIFTVVGIRVAWQHIKVPTLFLLVFVGVVTGVGGGVMRDVMAGDTPYIFIKHVYASASLAGALLCALLWQLIGELPSMLSGAALVLVIRLLSAHFRWNLPHGKAAK